MKHIIRPATLRAVTAVSLAGLGLMSTLLTAPPANAQHKTGVDYCGASTYVYIDHAYIHRANGGTRSAGPDQEEGQ